MSTNYYWIDASEQDHDRMDPRWHIGKRSAMGAGNGCRFTWAQAPWLWLALPLPVLDDTVDHIVNEYGERFTLRVFLRDIILPIAHHDTDSVGEWFA